MRFLSFSAAKKCYGWTDRWKAQTNMPPQLLPSWGHKKTLMYKPGNKLEGDIVSLQAQMSPYFQLREKFKYIHVEHTDRSKTQLITSP